MFVYADNAATTRMNKAAMEAMGPYLDGFYGNPSSQHAAGRDAAKALAQARAKMAKNLGCEPREILFTSGGSEADNLAVFSAAALGEKSGKKHIVSTAFEHPAILRSLDRLRAKGFSVTLLPVPENGVISGQQVEEAIRPDTCLVSVMYANHEIGTIQPISEIGRICCEKGVLFHTDAVQAAGHLPICVKDQQIGMLSLSAHKFHGPKGVGALYVQKGIQLEPMITGGGQERGLRAGTENVPGVVSMAAAFDFACAHREENMKKMTSLRDKTIDGLKNIPYSILNGDPVCRLPGNVNVCFEGVEAEALLFLLDQAGICASSGSACMSGSLEPSHVLLAIGRTPDQARSALRLSFGEENTEEQVDFIIETTAKAVSSLRGVKSSVPRL